MYFFFCNCRKVFHIVHFYLLQVSKEELAKLVQGFEKQDILAASGVTLAGNRYIYLSGTDRVVRAKLGKVGVHCMKTQQSKFLINQLTFFILLFFNYLTRKKIVPKGTKELTNT